VSLREFVLVRDRDDCIVESEKGIVVSSWNTFDIVDNQEMDPAFCLGVARVISMNVRLPMRASRSIGQWDGGARHVLVDEVFRTFGKVFIIEIVGDRVFLFRNWVVRRDALWRLFMPREVAKFVIV
jgi:hypothetical protein